MTSPRNKQDGEGAQPDNSLDQEASHQTVSSEGTESEKGSRLKEFMSAPNRAVWRLATPMMLGMVVHMAYMIVDTAFIGHLGREALAAATFVGPLFFFIIALISGLTTATTALVAQSIGRRDYQGAERVAGGAVFIGLVGGVVFAGALFYSGPHILRALGAGGESARLAWSYFRIVSLGMVLFFFSAALRAVLTGEGDTRTPVIVMIIASFINGGLDPVFIFVLDMGIAGAAVATLCAQVFTTLVLGYLLFVRRRSVVKLELKNIRFYAPLFWGLLSIGLPTTAGQLVMSTGQALYNRLLSGFGEYAVAAYGAASKIDMIVAMPLFGLAAASVSLIGMFAGAKRSDLVRYTALYAYRWAIIISVSVGISAVLASRWVLRLFTDDALVIETGRVYLYFVVFGYPMMAFGMTTGRILQGLGHGLPSFIITSVRVLGVGVTLAYLAVYVFDAPIEAVWGSIVVGGLISNVLSFFWVRRIVWRGDPTKRASGKSPRLARARR